MEHYFLAFVATLVTHFALVRRKEGTFPKSWIVFYSLCFLFTTACAVLSISKEANTLLFYLFAPIGMTMYKADWCKVDYTDCKNLIDRIVSFCCQVIGLAFIAVLGILMGLIPGICLSIGTILELFDKSKSE